MTIEKSANPNDEASQRELLYNEQARVALNQVEQQRLATYKKLLEAGEIDGATCKDCGVDLPDQRIAECRLRCTGCQSDIERRIRTGRGN
jgi:predicted Zn-ribbon and HTH transcriptional regulator